MCLWSGISHQCDLGSQYQKMNNHLSMKLMCQRNLTVNGILYFFCLHVFRHHGSLSTVSCLSPPPVTYPPSFPLSCLFLHLSFFHLPSSFHRLWATTLPLPTTWRERKGRRNGAPWTSSAWQASSREERDVCWWSTAGRFPNTTPHTCKAQSTSAAPNWWRGACSRTRCRSLSCCSPTARSRWVRRD